MGFSGSGGNSLNGVSLTGTPMSGQTIEATSPTQAEWITGGGGPRPEPLEATCPDRTRTRL